MSVLAEEYQSPKLRPSTRGNAMAVDVPAGVEAAKEIPGTLEGLVTSERLLRLSDVAATGLAFTFILTRSIRRVVIMSTPEYLQSYS